MTKLSTAFAAALSARVWVALLGLLAMPIYLRQLGADDFGVVGFFVSLQVIVNFLDLGLGASLIRKLSIHHKADPELACCYALTYERAYAGIGITVLALLLILSPWLAYSWLNPAPNQLEDLPGQLRWAAVAICLTWMSTIYSSMLTGLELQSRLAAIQAIAAALRFLVPVAAVFWQTDLTSFFMAHTAVAIVQWCLFRWAAYRHLTVSNTELRAQWLLLGHEKNFSKGMLGIALTTFLITQLDKIMLSKMLSLTDFGIYSLCITLASGIYVAVQPLFNLLYPRFSRLIAPELESDSIHLYRVGAQTMALLVIPVATTMIIFAPEVLWVWTAQDSIAEKGESVLKFLVIANAINAVMNLPYALQLAHGWSSLPMRVNIIAVIFLIPSMVIATEKWGATGASFIIFFLYVMILLSVPYITHRRLLKKEFSYWLRRAVFIPTLVCVLVALTSQALWSYGSNRWWDLCVLIATTVVSSIVVVALSPDIRSRFSRFFQLA